MTLTPDFEPTPSVEPQHQADPAPEAAETGAVVTGYGFDAPITLDLDADVAPLQGDMAKMNYHEEDDLSHLDGIGERPAVGHEIPMVLGRSFVFFDPAAPAVLAALPPAREDGTPLVLTHLQLRSLAVAAILSLNDMNTPEILAAEAPQKEAVPTPVLKSVANQEGLGVQVDEDAEGEGPRNHPVLLLDEADRAAGISALPNANVVAERVERVIDELVKGYLVEVPRLDPVLDDIDRAVKHTGFVRDEAWTKRLVQGAPQTAYQITPEGVVVGRMIRTNNGGPVNSVAGGNNSVLLPTKGLGEGEDPIARIAFAAVETGHVFLLDHLYGAMQLKPGEMGRMLDKEAVSIHDSLLLGDNQNLDVVGGKIISNLDALTDSVGAFLLDEEADVLLGDLPVRHQEIAQVVHHTLESLAIAPELARDPYVLESLASADAVCAALRVIENARVRGGGDFASPAARQAVGEILGPKALDTRLATADKEAATRMAKVGMNPALAEEPLVHDDVRLERVVSIVKEWVANTWAAGNEGLAAKSFNAFMTSLPTPAAAGAA